MSSKRCQPAIRDPEPPTAIGRFEALRTRKRAHLLSGTVARVRTLPRQFVPAFWTHGHRINGLENLRVGNASGRNGKPSNAVHTNCHVEHHCTIVEKIAVALTKWPCSDTSPDVSRKMTTCHGAADLVPMTATTYRAHAHPAAPYI